MSEESSSSEMEERQPDALELKDQGGREIAVLVVGGSGRTQGVWVRGNVGG